MGVGRPAIAENVATDHSLKMQSSMHPSDKDPACFGPRSGVFRGEDRAGAGSASDLKLMLTWCVVGVLRPAIAGIVATDHTLKMQSSMHQTDQDPACFGPSSCVFRGEGRAGAGSASGTGGAS